MMKLWSRLCFLVLAISSISRGQNETIPHNKTDSPDPLIPTPPPLLLDKTENEAPSPMPSSPSPQSHTSAHATDLLPTDFTTQKETPVSGDYKDTETTEGINGSTAAQTTASINVPGNGKGGDHVGLITTVSTTTASTPSKPVTIEGADHTSWGYVVLVLIILVIIILCVILYLLRRVSRTYSFDLQRPSPVDRHNEPIGTFEPVYLDDLDRPAPKDQVTTDDLSPPPAANGTTLQSEERGSNGERAPQDQPNGLENSPTSNTSPSLGADPSDKTPSPLSSTNLFFDAIGEEQQNENNNNPSVCSSDPFVEINLDDPAWCDQFLSSPEAPSSVLPFSHFSFSSSSS